MSKKVRTNKELLDAFLEDELGLSAAELRVTMDARINQSLSKETKLFAQLTKAFKNKEITKKVFREARKKGKGNFNTIRSLKDIIAPGTELGHKNLSVLSTRLTLMYKTSGDAEVKSMLLKAIVISQQIDRLKVTEVFKTDNPAIDGMRQVVNSLKSRKESTISIKGVMNRAVGFLKGTQTSELEFEDIYLNQYKAQIASLLGTGVNDYIRGKQTALDFFDDINYLNIKSSPSFKDDLEKVLDQVFHTGKAKKIVTKKRYTAKKTIKINPKSKRTINKKNRERKKAFNALLKIKQRTSAPNMLGLTELINDQLENALKNIYMGKSSEPPVRLRNQTGRFAESAEVQLSVLNRRQDAVQIFYTYMKKPYDVFEPGGKLHKPQRNPRAIVGGAVRDIAIAILGQTFKVRTTFV